MDGTLPAKARTLARQILELDAYLRKQNRCSDACECRPGLDDEVEAAREILALTEAKA